MVFKWMLLSLVIQAIFMAYLNYIYIPSGGNYKTTMYEYSNIPKGGLNIRLPINASKISVSFNGNYVGYLKFGELFILETHKEVETRILKEGEGEVSCLKWLPDRDILIYSLNLTEKNSTTVSLATYNVQTGEKNYYPDINNLPENSEVVDIKLSPLTNIVYLKVKTAEAGFSIYRYDIMDNLKLITTAATDINIEETFSTDNLIYEYKNKIYVRNGQMNSKKDLEFNGKAYLLGTDSEDSLYVGVLDVEDRIIKIHYGKANGNIDKEWGTLELDDSISTENIIITREGLIIENNKEEKFIRVINGHRELNYKGDLIEIKDNYIVTKEKNTLSIKQISLK